MDRHLRTVTVRIARGPDGGLRAWSDDLTELSLVCPDYGMLFAQLKPEISLLLEKQGCRSTIVREIYQFIIELHQDTNTPK